MLIQGLHKQECQKEVVDTDHFFSLAYYPEIDEYVMMITVFWIASYERFYHITEDDYNLYIEDKEKFYKKFERELSNTNARFTENFIGSVALRDYDGMDRFQDCYPAKDKRNAFQGYNYIDGIFYARIVWEDEEIYVPPCQAVRQKEGDTPTFPLHEKCEYKFFKDGTPICFKLKEEFYE